MKGPDIVITGMGGISAAGNDLEGTLRSFCSGRRNAGPVSLFSTSLTYPVFEVKDACAAGGRDTMRTVRLAFRAVAEACREAGLSGGAGDHRVGVCFGTTVASQLNDVDFYREFRGAGSAPMGSVDRFLNGNLAGAVAREIDARGPNCTVVNACSSGADAVGVGLSWLRGGLCDMVIAGGDDEMNRVPLDGFGSLSIVSNDPCAPFDRDRQGLNLGEGAGVLVLETVSSARKRGRDMELFLAGYGSACDAYHLTAPRPDGTGLEAALVKALREAGIAPADADFVNAHGTATRDNDRVEGTVLARVFGDDVTFLSTKGFTGHTLGAAGALEAVFTAMALREGWIPASAGFTNRDEEIPVQPVREMTEVKGRYAVSTSLAFGGNNAALVIGKG